MPEPSHLSSPPECAAWCDTLCIEAFDELAAAAATESGARALVRRHVGDGATQRVLEGIVEVVG